jgi:hypothetical protein
MKLLAYVSVVFTALAVIDCKPVDVDSAVSVSAASMSASQVYVSAVDQEDLQHELLEMPFIDNENRFGEARIIAPAPVLAPLPDDLDSTEDPIPKNEDSNTILKEPIVELVSQTSEDAIISPQQPALLPKALASIRAVANQMGPCKPLVNDKCEVLKKTDGITCSNSSAGVDCNTRKGVPCDNETYDTCIDFVQLSGVFCSIGDCAQFL